MNNQDIRWMQRFENYGRACKLLAEIYEYKDHDTPAIIREGFIQRFEMAFDLAWKTISDYLTYEGVSVQPTPRAVIKQAFTASVLPDGQVFLDMLEARNLMSHTYDEETFTTVFMQIQEQFYPALDRLCVYFEGKQV